MTSDNVENIGDGRVRLLAASPAQQVMVEGRLIPRLGAIDHGDMVEIILDGRLSYAVPAEWSALVAAAMAQSLAIGAGYSHIGADSPGRPFAPQVMLIDGVEK